MKSWIEKGLAACLALATISLAGCGGGGAGSTPQVSDPSTLLRTDSTHGALSFQVVFPTVKRGLPAARLQAFRTRGNGPNGTYDGTIPIGSHSVTIRLTNPTTGALLAPIRVVSDTQRPDGVNGSISVGFGLLPVGPVKVDIAAYPDLAASGNPLAKGAAMGQITALSTTTLDVSLTLTIVSLTLTPPMQTLHTLRQPMSGQLTGTALDANGNPLIYPLDYTVDNPMILSIDSVSADFMVATLTPLPGSDTPVPVIVTVTEPNSGMTATAQVIVAP